MKFDFRMIVVLFILSIPTQVPAAPPHTGGYATGFVGAIMPLDSDPQTFDFVTGSIFNDRVEYDPGLSIGGAAGYDGGYYRIEAEISYKGSEIDAITEKGDNFGFLDVDGDVGALAMLFNVFVDLHNQTPVTPYLGGGIGFAALMLSDTFGVDTRGGAAQRVQLYAEDTDTVFAYQFGAGVEIAFNAQYSMDIGYRYFGTDTGKFGNGSGTSTSLKFAGNIGMVGFRVNF